MYVIYLFFTWLSSEAFKKVGWMAVRLTVMPGMSEAVVVGLFATIVFGMSATLGLSLGFILGAVSPAVGPGRYCSPCHRHAFGTLVSRFKWHPMTWRAICAWRPRPRWWSWGCSTCSREATGSLRQGNVTCSKCICTHSSHPPPWPRHSFHDCLLLIVHLCNLATSSSLTWPLVP